SGSLQSACASTKSMPCFSRLAADFAGSNSKSTRYRNYTRTAQTHQDFPRFRQPSGKARGDLRAPGPPRIVSCAWGLSEDHRYEELATILCHRRMQLEYTS